MILVVGIRGGMETKMANINLGAIINGNPAMTKFLDNIRDAIYIVDDKRRYIYINKAAEEVDGYLSGELYGRTLQEVYGLRIEESPLSLVCETGKKIEGFAYRYPGNGKDIYQICNAYPIYIGDTLCGAYAIQYNITQIKEMLEENLRLRKKLYALPKSGVPVDTRGECKVFDKIIGLDPDFVNCIKVASLAAKGDSSIFLTGRTGTGKELFAKCIHEYSARRNKPFLAVNCSAIPETLLESILFGTAKGAYTGAVEKTGLFEQAEGGTLFLDEINSMPLFSQAKLLRVLEERELRHLGGQKDIGINVRIISSSNTLPNEAIEKKQIREDLFYRLAVINVVIPDLAARKSDIMLLANHFIRDYNEKFGKSIVGVDSEVEEFFLSYNWPGNVRQLRHCIEAAMNFVSPADVTIQKNHLPQYIFFDIFPPCEKFKSVAVPELLSGIFSSAEETEGEAADIFTDIQENEKNQIIQALLANNGNVTQTAKMLNMHRNSLIYRMKKYNITKK